MKDDIIESQIVDEIKREKCFRQESIRSLCIVEQKKQYDK